MSSGLSPRRLAKRTQIASAARTLFLTQGLAGTPMDAVTAAAGVSKQTLYSYFATKNDLLSAVLAEELARLDVGQDRPVELTSAADLRKVLLGFATGFTSVVLTPESVALVRLLLGEVSHIPELRDGFRTAFPVRLLAMITEILRSADASGIARVPSPEVSARMFLGPLMTYVALDGFLSTSNEVAAPSPAELELITDALLRSLEVRL